MPDSNISQNASKVPYNYIPPTIESAKNRHQNANFLDHSGNLSNISKSGSNQNIVSQSFVPVSSAVASAPASMNPSPVSNAHANFIPNQNAGPRYLAQQSHLNKPGLTNAPFMVPPPPRPQFQKSLLNLSHKPLSNITQISSGMQPLVPVKANCKTGFENMPRTVNFSSSTNTGEKKCESSFNKTSRQENSSDNIITKQNINDLPINSQSSITLNKSQNLEKSLVNSEDRIKNISQPSIANGMNYSHPDHILAQNQLETIKNPTTNCNNKAIVSNSLLPSDGNMSNNNAHNSQITTAPLQTNSIQNFQSNPTAFNSVNQKSSTPTFFKPNTGHDFSTSKPPNPKVSQSEPILASPLFKPPNSANSFRPYMPSMPSSNRPPLSSQTFQAPPMGHMISTTVTQVSLRGSSVISPSGGAPSSGLPFSSQNRLPSAPPTYATFQSNPRPPLPNSNNAASPIQPPFNMMPPISNGSVSFNKPNFTSRFPRPPTSNYSSQISTTDFSTGSTAPPSFSCPPNAPTFTAPQSHTAKSLLMPPTTSNFLGPSPSNFAGGQLPPPLNSQGLSNFNKPPQKPLTVSTGMSQFGPYPVQNMGQGAINQFSQQLGGLSVTQEGWNKGWGTGACDLLQTKVVLPPKGVVPPKPALLYDMPTVSPDIFRSTLTKVPETQSALQKSRMPFGLLIHPFRDLDSLAVVSSNTIVRCRSCRTYINPYVAFKSERKWECNLCFRMNELPEEFLYDPVSQTCGDPTRRPEVREPTIEFVAPQEYMLRPPQPATYVFVLDVSQQAVETGYLEVFSESLLSYIDRVPGDKRTQMGFITYSKTVQFYMLTEGQKSIQILEVGDLDDIFLPSPNDLLVNIEEYGELVDQLLSSFSTIHSSASHHEAALGAAINAAYKLVAPIGGRISLFCVSLPTIGPGALKQREDPNQRSSKDVSNLGPATDFYKRIALDCSGQQVAVDLFTLNSHFIDLATLTGISRFSGGCIHHFPSFHLVNNPSSVDSFRNCLIRYFTRKIGFEAVMRIRATRGISITNFHGNFFVRSTDLLALPNVDPDSGFGMQVMIEEQLQNIRHVSFQAALLYTSSKGERRIRVHTLCLPVTSNVHEIVLGGDQEAIVGFLAKMAVDKSFSASMSDAREALVNSCADMLAAYRITNSSSASYGLPAPANLSLLPLHVLGLLKSMALRHGVSTKLDDRVFAMCEMKTLPLSQLLRTIYPHLYAIHNLSEEGALSEEDLLIPQPDRLHLSSEYIDRTGVYLMDTGPVIYMYIKCSVDPAWINDVLGVPSFAAIPQPLFEDPLSAMDNYRSELVRNFIAYLQKDKPYPATVFVIRDDNPARMLFISRLVDDKSDNGHSYTQFLQFIKAHAK